MSKKIKKTSSDDSPEVAQKDIEHTVKRKGLKKKPSPGDNQESAVRYQIRLEDFDQHFEWLARYLESNDK